MIWTLAVLAFSRGFPAESGGNDDDAADRPRDQQRLESAAVARFADAEKARGAERGGKALRRLAVRFHHQTDLDVVGIERHAEAEEEQEDQRQHHGDQNAARVAHDLQRLLRQQRHEAPGAATLGGFDSLDDPGDFGAHAASSSALSDCSTRWMKASSSDGLGTPSRAARAFRSSGEPSATVPPR